MAESVDERVVGRDGGGGLNEGECVAGWWWRRRRRYACGAGGGGVNEAAALAATATIMAVMEAAEKEVAVKVGWLNGSMPSNARHEGENKWPSNCSTAEASRHSHPQGAS